MDNIIDINQHILGPCLEKLIMILKPYFPYYNILSYDEANVYSIRIESKMYFSIHDTLSYNNDCISIEVVKCGDKIYVEYSIINKLQKQVLKNNIYRGDFLEVDEINVIKFYKHRNEFIRDKLKY